MSTYTPAEVARRLSVPDRTLRYWSSRFSGHLSPDAVSERREKGSGHRRFSDADLQVLATVKALAAKRVPLGEIEEALRRGTRANQSPSDLPPANPSRLLPPSPPSPLKSQPAPKAPPSTHPDTPPHLDMRPAASEMSAREKPLPATIPDPSPSGPSEVTPVYKPTPIGPTEGDARSQVSHPAEVSWRSLEERIEELTRGMADMQSAMAEIAERLSVLECSRSISMLSPEPEHSPRWWLPWPLSLLVRRPRPGRSLLARRVARLMAERMWTRRDLARAAGVHLRDLDDLLTGRQSVTPADILNALSGALGVPLAELQTEDSPTDSGNT